MIMVLVLRLSFPSKERQSSHQWTNGWVWYDKGADTGTTKDFMGFSYPSTSNELYFNDCKDRGFGPDRTIIALAPSGNSIITSLKTQIDSDIAPYGLTTQLYASREEILNVIGGANYEKDGNPGICFGAALVESDDTNNKYQVNMIFDDIPVEESEDSNMPNQEFEAVDPYRRKPDTEAYQMYQVGGYTYLQNLIANEILQHRTNSDAYISMAHAPMKTNDYNDDDFMQGMSDLWNFFMLLIFLAPLYRFVANSVAEKETKMREVMKIMGLTDAPYWLSWFTYYVIVNTIQCVIMTLILIAVFKYSNLGFVFLYLWLYGMSLFGYGIFVGAFFSNGKTAAITATMLFYLTSFIYVPIAPTTISETTKTVLSFFPAVGVQLGGINLLEFEASGLGLTSSNSNELYKNYRFATTLWMLVLHGVVLGVLGLYLENVLPAAVGVRKPLWYPFTKSYWCGQKKADAQNGQNANDIERHGSNKIGNSQDDEDTDRKELDPANFEDVPEQLRRKEDNNEFIKITNLKKKFDGGFYAINNLNAEMYEDQIFALLGHNGAGKTTTISVLSGMLAATKGQSTIYGHDTRTEMAEIRKIMGYCPQHNVLFPKLTVREHLSIFADFKGMPRNEVNDEINQLLIDLNLVSKKNVLSKNLSGGYKRKLSLGIALIGGSKVVFLDEPSSGMDVTARREMWDMLKKYRNDRIIILTTHYMEEADNLGDRIGIMSHGQMLCCGTPDFLKNRFGEGYNLTVVKNGREENHQLEDFIKSNVPKSTKVSEVSSEATYLLPKDSVQHFAEFFKKFDQELSNLSVSSYGVSMTTLEEVFLQVEKGDQQKEIEEVEKIKRRLTSNLEENKGDQLQDKGDYSISKEQIEGSFAVFWLHFTALFIKRLILSKRNFKGFIVDLLIPCVLIITGFGLSTIEFFNSSDQRVLTPSLFPLTQRVMYNTADISGGDVPADLINNLTPASSFSASVATYITGTDNEKLNNFDDALYEASRTGPLDPFRFGHYYFNSIDYTNHKYKIITFFNSTSQESTVAFPHFMYQAILKKSVNANLEYTMVNDPMPIVQIFKDRDKGGNGFFMGFVLGIAFALVPSSIIGFILNERVNQLVHQQVISGMNKISYWVSNFIFDILKVFVSVIFAIVFLYVFDLDLKYAWLLLLLFPTALVPYTYVTSFMFSDESAAINFTIIHNFLAAGLVPIVMFVLILIKSTRPIGNALIWLPRFIPSYNLCEGIIAISVKDTVAVVKGKSSMPHELDIEVAGADLVILILHPFIWIFILMLIEVGCCSFLRSKGKNIEDQQEELDDDVKKEHDRIDNTSEDKLAVKADHVRKTYGSNVAVKDVSFGLDFGDCFALLGVNGAGKTTTFKMLTNDVVPTRGNAFVSGFNSKSQFADARKQIGYCPQFDAIFGLMTVREHLEFYAKIKKIPKEYVEDLIKDQLKSMNLEQYENKKSGTLSGGNKRKLSVAMAMLGNPPVVFLDEPSAGMDPKARRFMWEIIARISTRGKNSAVILTTHSMEEAEALSTNMGIMVDGQFKCFGSKQHIKNKFGKGYQVEIKFKTLNEEAVKQQMESLNVQGFVSTSYASCFKIENRKGQPILMLNKQACIGVLKDLLKNESAMNEFHEEGFGNEIIETLEASGYYPAASLIRWEHVMRNNQEALKALVEEFGSALLLEQYTPRYRYRVPKGDKSVGYFFSFMEKLKEKIEIDEYSASQTTLEQIFNGFARIDEAVVLQREFTVDQLGIRGASHISGEVSKDLASPNARAPIGSAIARPNGGPDHHNGTKSNLVQEDILDNKDPEESD